MAPSPLSRAGALTRELTAMGRGHPRAPGPHRARRGAARHVGRPPAHRRGRAGPLAQGGVAARRAARRARGHRARARTHGGRAGGARRGNRSRRARRGALPLPRPRRLGRRRQDALPGGLLGTGPHVRTGAAGVARGPGPAGSGRRAATGRRASHRARDRRPLAAGARNGGFLELARRLLVLGAAALIACRGDRAGASGLRIPGEADGGPRITVEVLNASGKPGLAKVATRLLRRAGIDVVTFGNAPETVGTLDSTRIAVRRGTRVVGERLRKPLGVGRVSVQPDTTRLLDASVFLGADFAPRLEFHP